MVYDLIMNIANSVEAKYIDSRISRKYNISPLLRMESAGYKSSEIIKKNFNLKKVLVVIGLGNNGGDAAVVARYLKVSNIEVNIYLIKSKRKRSKELNENINILKKLKSTFIEKISTKSIQGYDLILDGIFGIGLNRDIRKDSHIYKVINMINKSKNKVCALDIPSGLSADTGTDFGISIKSDLTITFDILKVGLINDPGYKKSKKIHLVNLGTPNKDLTITKNYFVNEKFFINQLLPRDKSSNKGSHGHTLIIGGSKNMPGAITISGLSAYRAGCGLVSICVPKCIGHTISKSVPEAIIIEMPNSEDKKTFDQRNFIKNLESKLTKNPSSIVIGPGMGNYVKFRKLIFDLIKNFDCKFILDADALNSLGDDIFKLKKYKRKIIITPHPGEMARILGLKTKDIQIDRNNCARSFSKKSKLITVLKGFRTVVSDINDNVYINSSGNEGMATGGMGDSLSGIIGSLAAQGYSELNSAIIGVYIHGKAGDIIFNKSHSRGILATDIIKNIPKSFEISNKNHFDERLRITIDE